MEPVARRRHHADPGAPVARRWRWCSPRSPRSCIGVLPNVVLRFGDLGTFADAARAVHRPASPSASRAGGPVPFEEFVEAALYDPTAASTRPAAAPAAAGDFLTSPEVGPLFGAVLARALDAWWASGPARPVRRGRGRRRPGHPGPRGAGGAAGLPRPAPALRRRRAARPRSGRPHAGLPVGRRRRRCPPSRSTGVVLANELLDNLPFRLAGPRRRLAGGGRRTARRRAAFVEVLGAPVAADVPALPARRAPAHGARAPVQQAGARAGSTDALGRLRRRAGRGDRLRAADRGDGRPPVAGVAAHLPRPRARRAPPGRRPGRRTSPATSPSTSCRRRPRRGPHPGRVPRRSTASTSSSRRAGASGPSRPPRPTSPP